MQAIRFLHKAFFPSTPHDPQQATYCLDKLRQCVAAWALPDPDRSGQGHAQRGLHPTFDQARGSSARQRSPALRTSSVLLENAHGTAWPPASLILVDWSPINAASDLYLLRASIPLAGRAFPVYESVHDREGCPQRQRQLLDALELMLPDQCVPILVTDAEFRRLWFQAVEAKGWYYVGRVRNRDLYRDAQGHWQPIKHLYQWITSTARSLGEIEMTRRAPHQVALYGIHQPAKGRKHRRVTGSIARSKRSRQNARREQEPWLLASNLPQTNWTARQIVGIYRKRMQIEDGFRDVKSLRFGFAFDLHRTRGPRHIEILPLIAAMVCYALYRVGLQAKATGGS